MRRTPLERLEASNLGQIVGRQLLGGLAPARLDVEAQLPRAARCDTRTVTGRDSADEPDTDVPPAEPRVRTVRAASSAYAAGPTALVRQVLARHPEGLHLGALRVKTGLERTTLGATLNKMGGIEKSGGRRHYLYRLKDQSTENP